MAKQISKPLSASPLLALCGLLALPTAALADDLSEAMKNGKVGLDFRLRYEDVSQAVNGGSDKEGHAFTLLSRLNYLTGNYNGLTAFAEVDNVTALGNADYNTAANDIQYPDKPVIPDPEYTQVNQVWLNYNNWDSDFKYGRQRILLDNQRYVGGVGFRQNEQTYSGFSAASKALENVELYYSYVYQVHRIFDPDNPIAEHDNDTHLLNASYSGLPVGKITAYYYDIDNDNVAGFSTATAGARLAGKSSNNDVSLMWALEYARQQDSGNNTKSYDADYYLLEGGATVAGISFLAGYEVLGADGSDGYFVTPLATLHKFQGWADVFLNGGAGNITGGIADAYASVSGAIGGVKLQAVYHRFESDDDRVSGMDTLGSEVNLSASYNWDNYGVSIQYADYDADDFATDTEKLWLTATAKF